MKTARLEDFGARGTVGPKERFKQYQADCKALPKAKQGKFWLEILDHDHDVRKLLDLKENRRRRT